MTPLEHAMLAVNGTLCAGLYRRGGWQISALAGVAAVTPDWDGLSILFSRSMFAAGHRVWGHNAFACALTGILLGVLDYRFDMTTRCGHWMVRRLRMAVPDGQLAVRRHFSARGYLAWIMVATLAAASHLAGDMVVSGSAAFSDWPVPVLWPLSNHGWVYPRVAWGDPGITVLFVMGMFAMVRWKYHLQMIGTLTLLAVGSYLAVRPLVGMW
jgi:hypothetical protein